ncbi:hypothetical protein PAXRUDRAFT_14097 [Paxillus rubicundulus Ve08.2h10]|uniref:Uncharacterized protein n=1 Tax=Paxillus rubicundulus Ve08.2h10 TaxID=930991 RepID=A0A0D0D321_9AGAM|nr:hypothetical protein PAXRUDRAFT_14097 [Paxillus rubicundulus Ve08.2h10]
MATNSVSLQTQHNSTNILPRTVVAIDKSDAIKMLKDVLFLEIDGIVPNWNMYSFSVQIDTPGVKVIVSATSTETKEDTTPILTSIKIEPTEVKHEADTDQGNNTDQRIETDQRNETKELELAAKVEDYTSSLFPKPSHVTPMARLVLKCGNLNPKQEGHPWHYWLRQKRAASMEPLSEEGTGKHMKMINKPKCRSI